jgi:hypothetical protein
MMIGLNSWIPVIGTLGGALLGGAASFLGGIIGQWMTLKREREARGHEAGEVRRRQWEEFQVKTLIELQDTLAKTNSAAFRTANLTGIAVQRGIPLEPAIKSESIYYMTRNRAIMLVSRVDDGKSRSLANDLLDSIEKLKHIGLSFVEVRRFDVTQLNSQYDITLCKFAETTALIGVVIRTLNKPE